MERFRLHCSVPQGAVESPFLWNAFYDILLCAIEDLCNGIELHIKVPHLEADATEPKTRMVASHKYTAIGYMDDAIFFANSREALQQVVDLVD